MNIKRHMNARMNDTTEIIVVSLCAAAGSFPSNSLDALIPKAATTAITIATSKVMIDSIKSNAMLF